MEEADYVLGEVLFRAHLQKVLEKWLNCGIIDIYVPVILFAIFLTL